MIKRLIFIHLLLGFISNNVFATLIIVAKTGGSFSQIQAGINASNPGDTVLVKSGSYSELISVPTSGTKNNYITIKGESGAIIDGTGLTLTGTCGLVWIENKSFIRLEGFTIKNAVQNSTSVFQAGIWVRGAGSNIEIRNNIITNIVNSLKNSGCHGIAVYGTNGTTSLKNIIVDGNEVYGCQLGWSESLVLNGNVDGFTVSNNSVHDNNNIGIDFIGHEGECPTPALDQARNGVCTDNHVYNITSKGNAAYGSEQSADGLYIDGGLNIIFERNIIDKCDIGIELASEWLGKNTENITVRNNFISRSYQGNLQAGGYDSKRGNAVNCSFINNTTYQSEQGELVLQYNCNGISIYNNIFISKSGNDYLNEWGSKNTNITASNNIYWGSSANSSGSWTDLLGKYADPKLLNSYINMHIDKTSPAIDNGIMYDAGIYDIDKQLRIQNNKIDIGADEYSSITSLFEQKDIENNDFKMYPNPGKDVVTIEISKKNEENQLSLYTLSGQELLTKQIKSTSEKVNISSFAKGTYLVKITNNKSTGILQLIKE